MTEKHAHISIAEVRQDIADTEYEIAQMSAGQAMRKELERLGLMRMEFPEDIARIAVNQVKPILDYHVKHFSAWVPPREQMKSLALDCYTQGLIHGNQLPKVKP